MTPAIDLSSTFIGNFRRVDARLFAGAQPQLPQGIQELASKYGIKTIIDLQGQQIQEEEAACESVGINFVSIPLPGVEIFCDPPKEKIQAIEEAIQTAAAPIFVHCVHGADRTGAAVAIYRVLNGATVKEAIREMRHYHNQLIEFGYRDAVSDYFEEKGKE